MKIIEKIKEKLNYKGFYVCRRIARKFGIRISKVRLFFIYFCFISFGLNFLFYLLLFLCFWIKDFFYVKRSSVFDF